MVKSRPYAALPRRHISQVGLQEVKALLDLGRDLLRLQHLDPGRGQENGQGHPLHQTTDVSDVRQILGL
jgi:hypothetical protein